MIPIRDNLRTRDFPIVVWTIIALNVLIYLWDRNGHALGPSVTFSDLAMRPLEITEALAGKGQTGVLGTVFTALFLHGNLVHLIGNLLFLFAFGPSVEQALGGFRFTLYYLLWGIMASAAHILVMPMSPIPALGASGAIGGVLGCYLLLFPGSRITVIIPPLPYPTFEVYAWMMLGMWFAFQIFLPQQGVANWAHAGGFVAGMATVLIAGGRSRLLKNADIEVLHEEVA